MRVPWLHPRMHYSGPLKIIEQAGQWGVYAGERVVLGDGRKLGDDLGIRLREAFQPGAKERIRRGEPLSESFELADVEIRITVRRR